MKKKKNDCKHLFNNRQLDVLDFNLRYRPQILLCHGAVGSGKTVVTLACFYEHLATDKDNNHDYIVIGYTMSSVERNVLKPLSELFGVDIHQDDKSSFQMFGNTVYCFGANNDDSYKAMRGIMTAYGGYINEMTLCHQNSINEMINRCRGEGARFFWETNPSGPQHPVYTTWIENSIKKGNNKKIAQFSFSLYDNAKENGGFLPRDYIERLENTYSGILRKQFILGKWESIEGQIYFLDKLQYYDSSVLSNPRWFFATITNAYLDPATGSERKTGCFTSVIVGTLKDGKIYIIDAIVRKIIPNQLNSTIDKLIRKHNYSVFAIEDNFSQDGYVVKPMKQLYPFINIQGVSNREDKLSRLIAMHPIVMEKVLFPESWRTEKNTDGFLLLQQLSNITKNRELTKDSDSDIMMVDAPDALEGLIRTFRNYGGTGRTARADDTSQQLRELREW